MRRSPSPFLSRFTAVLGAAFLLATPAAWADFAPDGIEIDGNYVDDAAPEADWFPDFPPMSDPVADEDFTLCGTSPAPKNDIINSFLANDYDYLWVGMERRTNNGNTSFFFKFDITGDGDSLGDFVFVFCFGSGAVVTETYVQAEVINLATGSTGFAFTGAANASISHVVVAGDVWSVRCYTDTSHLSPTFSSAGSIG